MCARVTSLCCAGVVAVFSLSAVGGCMEERVVNDPWADLRQFADSQQPERQSGGGLAEYVADDGWAILVEEFTGRRAERRARMAAQRLRDRAGIENAWYRMERDRARVYIGRYNDPAGPAAEQALADARTVEVDGVQPYGQARIVPLSREATGAMSEYDLRNYPGYYSLQIAFYDDRGEQDHRVAAEEAVQALREDDEEAYYHHSDYMSIVTIGLFTDADFQQRPLRHGGTIMDYGPRVRELQEQYPYNLGNGHTIVQRSASGRETIQPSFLVEVPH